jgi:Ni,Fe-hydrogenase I large subunit
LVEANAVSRRKARSSGLEGAHGELGTTMIDEEKARTESEKIVQMVDLALEVDVDSLRAMRPDVEFLATALDGWVAEMMQTMLVSMDAFLEYRAKLDVIVKDMGLEMLKGTKE